MTTLEIHCSKPECFWHGPPAEAADHLCPTPAAVEEGLVADLPLDDTQTSAASGLPLFATRDELEHWLANNGVYTPTGEPADAQTAEADRQYAIFLQAAAKGDPDPEPDLDAPEPDVEPAATVEEEEDAEIEGREVFDDDPWQIRVALQYQARDDAKQVRWLLIDEDAAELVDAFPIKAVAETALIEWLHGGREITLWRATDLVKAAADLENLAQPFGDEGPPVAPPGTVPADDPQLEPTAIEKLEQAAADAGGTLVTETEDVIQHPDQPVAAKEPVPLFNAADYDREDLAIPKIDGNPIDRIALNFSGSVMLDRSAPLDVGLYNGIHSEATVELWVEAKWGGTAATPATNRDGDLDVIVGRKTLRIESIRILDPAALGAVEGIELVKAAARRASRAGVPDDQIEAATIAALAEPQ